MIRALLALLMLSFASVAAAQPARTETAVFAGGCFWCMEHDMGAIPGVLSVTSGYTGGHVPNPTYEIVTGERSGHYEAVRVVYDPARISYRQILDRYWRLIDPTDNGGQFCDRGPSYRAAIFVTPAQRDEAEASKARLVASRQIRGQIVTQILPLRRFYEAEEYHRDYARRNAARYAIYRAGCGRDATLRRVWGRS
jgi:peptide-methionine (S)-S-oxide reductase